MRSNEVKPFSGQLLLAAQHGARRVTIGWDSLDVLRLASDRRELTCPGCQAPVILRAGNVRAAHFAHLPGAVCSLPASEPETEEHRAGKLLLAEWLRARVPEAEVIVEAFLPETQQRADILLVLPQEGQAAGNPFSDPKSRIQNPKVLLRRIAIEVQCANLSAREWRRRHSLYRTAGIEDLWLLGGSRLNIESDANRGVGTDQHSAPDLSGSLLRTTELERALLWDGAPLLFLDAVGERLAMGMLARFRPDADAQALRPAGRFSTRALLSLEFPWPLLAWPTYTHPDAPQAHSPRQQSPTAKTQRATPDTDWWLWEWLTTRYRVTPETLDGFFGVEVSGQEAFACQARVWQAAIYYRFVHRRVGDGWWRTEVETWARAYLPLARPANPRKIQAAIAGWQEVLAAGGLLSLPMGYNRSSARVRADLTTLEAPLDIAEVLKIARYRRTLLRESRADYGTR